MPPRKAGSYTSPNATQFLFSFMSPVCNTGCVLWIIINKTTDIFLFNRTFLFPCNPWTFSLLCLLELNVTFTSRTTENLLSQTWQISCRAAKDVGCRAQVHLNELCLLSFIQIPFFKKSHRFMSIYLSLPISSSIHESVIIVSVSLPVPDPEWIFPLQISRQCRYVTSRTFPVMYFLQLSHWMPNMAW